VCSFFFPPSSQEVADGMIRQVAEEVIAQVEVEGEALMKNKTNEELSKISHAIVDAAIFQHLANRIGKCPLKKTNPTHEKKNKCLVLRPRYSEDEASGPLTKLIPK
jgi:ribosomal protein S13